jgi:hypothetical protein
MQTNLNLLTWASIISCRKLNRYVVAIFKALLHPMIQTTKAATSEIIPTSSLVDDEEPVLLSKVKRARTCAYICLVIDFSSSPFIFNFYCRSHSCPVHSKNVSPIAAQY